MLLRKQQCAFNLAELCKGSTADSDSVCLGSNPSSAAIEKQTTDGGLFFLSLTAGLVAPNAVLAARQGLGSHMLAIEHIWRLRGNIYPAL